MCGKFFFFDLQSTINKYKKDGVYSILTSSWGCRSAGIWVRGGVGWNGGGGELRVLVTSK